jgi:NADH:ubiquinone oxidoreductase subunit 3 (subunit A)
MVFILYGLGVVFLFVWCSQFIQLMLLSDEDFPGKYGKALWFAAFILLNFIGCGLFIWWKQAYLHELKLTNQSVQ